LTTPAKVDKPLVENYPCGECGELADHKLHHDVQTIITLHFDECDYDASYEGEEDGWVASMLCHEYERGCYCADSGRCEVCVDKAVDFADHMRDVAKEDAVDRDSFGDKIR
jgi:hypothetical protein